MSVPRRFALLAFVTIAVAFGNTNSSQAATILQYSEINPATNGLVTTDNGSVTTFANSYGNASAPPIAVLITVDNAAETGTITFNAYLSFINFQSVAPVQPFGTDTLEQFSGTMSFTSNANATGTNYLTATFSDTYISGTLGQGALSASFTPIYTSSYYSFSPAATNSGSLAISDMSYHAPQWFRLSR